MATNDNCTNNPIEETNPFQEYEICSEDEIDLLTESGYALLTESGVKIKI